MGFDPVEGIHYIFDRYAYLNEILQDGGATIAPIGFASGRDDIAAAVKFGRVLHHPDRQAKTGEKNRQQAEQISGMIAECERILLNPDMKTAYDERLKSFNENNPQLVSRDGTPIISISDGFFDVRALLSDEVKDTGDFEKRAKEMLQYDEGEVPRMKALHLSMPAVAEIKDLYRNSLAKRLSYLDFLEMAAWAKVGYANRKRDDSRVTHADDYADHVAEDLAEISKRDIGEALEGHREVAKLGMSNIPLLLAFNGAAANDDVMDLTVSELKRKATVNFELRAEYVREIGRQKQDVLKELTAIPNVQTLREAKANDKQADFYVLLHDDDGGKRLLPFRFTLDIATKHISTANLPSDTTLQSLQEQGFERTSFAVTRTPEVPNALMEMMAAAEQFGRAQETRHKVDTPKP